jgi:hypothetical protein
MGWGVRSQVIEVLKGTRDQEIKKTGVCSAICEMPCGTPGVPRNSFEASNSVQSPRLHSPLHQRGSALASVNVDDKNNLDWRRLGVVLMTFCFADKCSPDPELNYAASTSDALRQLQEKAQSGDAEGKFALGHAQSMV